MADFDPNVPQETAFDGGVASDGGVSLPGGVAPDVQGTAPDVEGTAPDAPAASNGALDGAGTVRTDVGADGVPEALRAPSVGQPGAVAAAGADASAAQPAAAKAADPCKSEREKMEDSALAMTGALNKAILTGEHQDRTSMIQMGAVVAGTAANPLAGPKEVASAMQKNGDAELATKISGSDANVAMLQNAANVRRYNACIEANKQ
jgi:hypothetical protein